MTILEAIKNCHSIRRHKDTPLSEDVASALQQKISGINAEGNLNIQLVTNEPRGFNYLQ